MIDNEQHIQVLEEFTKNNPSAPRQWDVFVKVDTGYHRAGVMTTSPSLTKLIRQAEASPVISIYGFYCHAGHSYKCHTAEEAAAVLQSEVEGVVHASKQLPADRTAVVSVGSTPTAHVVQSLEAALPSNVKLELHAGSHKSFVLHIYTNKQPKLTPDPRKLPLQRPPTSLNRPRHQIPTSPPRTSRSLRCIPGAQRSPRQRWNYCSFQGNE